MELAFQVGTGQLGRRLAAGFQHLHFFFHLLEGRHGAIGAEAADGALQLLLGLGRLGPGLEHVLLGAGLGDLAFEAHQAFFERLHLARLALQLGVEGVGGVLVGLAAGEGFAGQVFLALLHGQLGPFVPGFGLGAGLLGLVLDAFLAGDRGGHGLAQLHQLRLHVGDGLVEDFAGIFGATQHRVGVGPHQSAKASKETHGLGGGAGPEVSQDWLP